MDHEYLKVYWGRDPVHMSSVDCLKNMEPAPDSNPKEGNSSDNGCILYVQQGGVIFDFFQNLYVAHLKLDSGWKSKTNMEKAFFIIFSSF